MKRDPLLYLEDMLTYAREAHEFAQGMTTASGTHGRDTP